MLAATVSHPHVMASRVPPSLATGKLVRRKRATGSVPRRRGRVNPEPRSRARRRVGIVPRRVDSNRELAVSNCPAPRSARNKAAPC